MQPVAAVVAALVEAVAVFVEAAGVVSVCDRFQEEPVTSEPEAVATGQALNLGWCTRQIQLQNR